MVVVGLAIERIIAHNLDTELFNSPIPPPDPLKRQIREIQNHLIGRVLTPEQESQLSFTSRHLPEQESQLTFTLSHLLEQESQLSFTLSHLHGRESQRFFMLSQLTEHESRLQFTFSQKILHNYLKTKT